MTEPTEKVAAKLDPIEVLERFKNLPVVDEPMEHVNPDLMKDLDQRIDSAILEHARRARDFPKILRRIELKKKILTEGSFRDKISNMLKWIGTFF